MDLLDARTPHGSRPHLESRGRSASDAVRWTAVSADRPCPCCGVLSGCSVSADGVYAHCRQAVSCWPVSGGGWLHRVPATAAR